ncbi:MAG: DnaD domain protein [Clostridiales bacterium]|nr:DnaD domain protein [Clostridiales bacterium]
MALFDADTAGVLWDSVALPNAFIIEYMPTAPENYVKVYVYGLLHARYACAGDGLTVQSLAKELGMEEADVLSAFQYWERARLISRTQDKPPRFTYLNVQQAMMGRQAAPADDRYMEFAQALYAIFGDRRKLHGGETQLCYEWVEQLGLPSEVVLLLVQHLAFTRGVNFSFKAAQKVALEMKERNIVSLEDAEQFFARSSAAWDGTRKVLRRISKFRPPTTDEIDLYLKWTKEWGFAPKAIEAACAEMIGGDPSFKYLDSILRGIRERSGRKATTAAQLEKQLENEQEESADIREVLSTAGLKISPNHPAVKESYQKMLAMVGHGAVVLAAREISRSKKNQTLQKLEELVERWHEKGIQTEEDVHRHLSLIKQQNAVLQALFSEMGAELSPSPADRELLSKWREDWAFSDDILKEIAGYSRGKSAPMAFMNKVLESFHKKGVNTLAAVCAAHEEHQKTYQPPAKKRGKTVIEQQYKQREYEPGRFSKLTPEEIEEALKYGA